jgi:TatD DNase family protein
MLIDAHSHLDRYALLGPGALERALEEITRHSIFTVSNSMDIPSYERNLAIAASCRLVLPTFGVHPWNAPQYAGRLDELRQLVDRTPLIGEVGLDHHFVSDAAQYPAQRRVLELFLTAAREQRKIVILHTKGAEEELLELLDRHGPLQVIVHWYSGPLEILRELLRRGAYFTVGVEVLHSARIQAIAREIPLERLLTETDNPGGPMEFLGESGMPLLVRRIVERMAEERQTTAEALERAVRGNLLRLFRESPWLAEQARVLEELAPNG